MLKITLPAQEIWDERSEEFVTYKEQTLQLEHSLISISKWESKWHKSFLKSEKTDEEILDYIRCMTVTQNVKEETYARLTENHLRKIYAYIDDPMTATTFYDDEESKKPNNETITSELIYYWMIAQNIPVEFEKWHINRLIALIRVCSIKNAPPKKRMSEAEIKRRNHALNEARKKQLNTKG